MLHSADRSVLLIIDLQDRLMPAIHGAGQVLRQAIKLGRVAKLMKIPVIATEHMPAKLGPTHHGVLDVCGDVISKVHFNACRDNLMAALSPGCKRIVLAGCETHVCVLQTALGLIEEGREITVVSDAVGSRSIFDHDAGLSRMSRAGVEICTFEMMAFEWLQRGDHPEFRDVLRLIK